MEVPTVAVESVRKELIRLYGNAFHLIAHGLSLHRGTIKSTQDLGTAVAQSRRLMPVDMDEYYERHIKPLYSAIVDFISNVQARQIPQVESDTLYVLREAGRNIVEAVKDMKHLHKNLSHNLHTTDDAVRKQYDAIRLQLASILRELNRIQEHEPDSDTILSLDAVAVELHESTRTREAALDELIRKRMISSQHATSLMNDNTYTYDISKNLLEMARPLFGSTQAEIKDAEQQLSLAESDLQSLATETNSESKAP
jgi:phosphate:Na+ symporter